MLKVTTHQFWMDGYLKSNLDTIIFNLKKDWDNVVIISGDALTRVGKSHLAQQIACYAAEKLGTPFSMDNMVFDSEELIKKGNSMPKNSVIVFDEAREGLDSKKIMSAFVKKLLDYFAECGMYNHLMIVVLPDFFELTKGVALGRSSCLINVFKIDKKKMDGDNEVIEWQRGRFEFFGQKSKKALFMRGKKFHDYRAAKCDFYGEFREHWCIDKELYNEKKREFLRRDRENNKQANRIKAVLKVLCNHMTQEQAAIELTEAGFEITQQGISVILRRP